MAFPFSMRTTIEYNIDDINISSGKYVLNFITPHIEQKKYWSIQVVNNELYFHKGLEFFLPQIFRFKDILSNGTIRIEVKDDQLIIYVKSYNIFMVIAVLVGAIATFTFHDYFFIYATASVFAIMYIFKRILFNRLINNIKGIVSEISQK